MEKGEIATETENRYELRSWGRDPGDNLCVAVHFGRFLDVARILARGLASRREVDRSLVCAASDGNCAIARELLRAGANPNFTSENGTTSLCSASRFGYSSMVDLLLSYGASRAMCDARGYTPAMLAWHAGWTEIACRLSVSRSRSTTNLVR